MRTSPSRSTIARSAIVLAFLLAGACKSLADKKEGPTQAEIEAAKARVDRARDLAIENQLQSDDDEEKEFWLSMLRQLGDYRARLAQKPAR
jgi:hypothetical protein